jgi:hypothetical protein
MLQTAGNASGVLAPIMAGVLIGPLGLAGILIIDLVCATVAIGALLFVHVPQPARTEAGREGEGHVLKEMTYGFHYIFARPSLLGLQTVFLIGNLFTAFAFAAFAPMILARTGNDELIFGGVQSAGAVGGVVGGLAMSVWGGPRRRVHGVLQGWLWSGLLGMILLGVGRTALAWAAGMFLWALFDPMLNGCNQAIWQAKVAPDVQGRVFTARLVIAWVAQPISLALAGPLADQVLEPAMAQGGGLAPTFSWLVGTGAGSGMSLLIVATGLLTALVGTGGYLFIVVRNAEDILPDHDHLSQDMVPG